MKVGYIRSSSISQNNEYQLKDLEKQNIEKYFIDKATGRNTDRKEFKQMLNFIREGDEVYIYDLSRLSRNLKEMLEIIDDFNNNNIRIISIKENIDSITPTGRLMLSMIGAVNEFIVTNQREKQLEGIKLAKEKGKYKGRKKIDYPKNWNETIEKWKRRDITATQAMQITGLKKATFYRLLKEYTLKLGS